MLSGVISLFIALLMGYFIKVKNRYLLKIVQYISEKIVYLILATMGMELAQLDSFGRNIALIAQYAALFFITISSCNFIALYFLDKKLQLVKKRSHESINILPMLLGSLKLILFVLLGFLIGYMIPIDTLLLGYVSRYSLLILLFVIGVQLRMSSISMKQILLNKVGLILAFVVLFSALLGGLIGSYLLGVPLINGLIMASGFGWYSLAGILISDALDPIYGSAAFFNELLREMSAIVLIPFIMPRFPLVAVGHSGATAMDFTLPLIQKSGGVEFVPIAIVSGFILSLALPTLVTIFSIYL